MYEPDNQPDPPTLSAATSAVLDRARIGSLDELRRRSPADLCAIPSMTSAMLAEVLQVLHARGTPPASHGPMPGLVDLDWELGWEANRETATD